LLKQIPSILKNIFLSSIIILLSHSLYSQTPAPQIINHGHDAPDTIIVERIKVQNKKIYIHKTDTIVKTDTLIQVQIDTFFQVDTVEQTNSQKKNKKDGFSSFLTYKVGPTVGVTGHFSHSHFFASQREYFELERESVTEKLNYHIGAVGQIGYKKVFIETAVDFLNLREEIDFADVNRINSLKYIGLDFRPGYKFKFSEKLGLDLSIGFGLQFLVDQDGAYIDPDNIEEIREDNDLYPTQSTLLSVSTKGNFIYKLTDKLELTSGLYYKYHPFSTTILLHPALYWRRNEPSSFRKAPIEITDDF